MSIKRRNYSYKNQFSCLLNYIDKTICHLTIAFKTSQKPLKNVLNWIEQKISVDQCGGNTRMFLKINKFTSLQQNKDFFKTLYKT